jgi:hypothetical protein
MLARAFHPLGIWPTVAKGVCSPFPETLNSASTGKLSLFKGGAAFWAGPPHSLPAADDRTILRNVVAIIRNPPLVYSRLRLREALVLKLQARPHRRFQPENPKPTVVCALAMPLSVVPEPGQSRRNATRRDPLHHNQQESTFRAAARVLISAPPLFALTHRFIQSKCTSL